MMRRYNSDNVNIIGTGEWVPADIAQEMYNALELAMMGLDVILEKESDEFIGYVLTRDKIAFALHKARGEVNKIQS